MGLIPFANLFLRTRNQAVVIALPEKPSVGLGPPSLVSASALLSPCCTYPSAFQLSSQSWSCPSPGNSNLSHNDSFNRGFYQLTVLYSNYSEYPTWSSIVAGRTEGRQAAGTCPLRQPCPALGIFACGLLWGREETHWSFSLPMAGGQLRSILPECCPWVFTSGWSGAHTLSLPPWVQLGLRPEAEESGR